MPGKKFEIDNGLRIGGLIIDEVTGDLITTGNIIVASPGQLVGAGLGSGGGTAESIPLVKLTEVTLNYAFGGNTIVGASSNNTITVTNLGTGPLTISNAAISGTHASDFSVIGCNSNVTANSSCALTVGFTPTAANTRISTLSLTHNGPDSPTVIQLSASAILAPIFNLTPTSLDFGTVNVFTTSTQVLSVTNTGSADLNITSLTVSGENSTNFTASGCFSSVPAGGSCAITVNFRPTFNSARSANLTIAHNGLTSPAVVSLTGLGSGTVTLGDWTYRDDLSRSTTVYGISATPVTIWSSTRSEFLVVGPVGSATSADGITWSYNSNLSTIIPQPKVGIWAAELNSYLVVGENAQASVRAALSSNGITWNVGTYNFGSITITAVAWSGTVFVLTTTSGIYTSSNGVDWTSRSTSSNSAWYSVTWTGTKFVIGGAAGYLAESTDGITWTTKTDLRGISGWTTAPITTVAWNGSRYYVGSWDSANQVSRAATSSDGTTWTAVTGSFPTYGVVWSTERSEFVGVTESYWFAYRSADGITWTQATLPQWPAAFGNGSYGVAWSGSTYLVTSRADGTGGVYGLVATSTDGTTWTYRDGLSQSQLYFGRTTVAQLTYATEISRYLAVGIYGRVATSTDGVTWTYQSGLKSTTWGSNTVYTCTWNGSKYLVAGQAGNVATSPDGITWTYRGGLKSTSWSTSQVNTVNWNGSQYLVSGASGKVATSTDGITWSYNSGLSSTAWGTASALAINWNGSQYLVVGTSGNVATSPDGITWTHRPGLASTTWSTTNVNAISWNGSQYLVVGPTGKAATSPDGITWTYRSGLIAAWGSSNANTVVWNGAIYVVAGGSGKVATSTDGVTWTYQPGLSTTAWGSTSVGTMVQTGSTANSKYVIGGPDGKIATNELGA